MSKFVTLNEVKDYIRMDRGHAKDDLFLNALIERKTKMLQQKIGRDIESGTYTDRFTPEDFNTKLFTEQYPIISHSGVTENDVTLTEGNDEDYWINYDLGILTRGAIDLSTYKNSYFSTYPNINTWYPGAESVEITYVAGFATIPDDIKDATIKLVAREFSDRDVDDIKKRGGTGMTFERGELKDGLPESVYSLVQPYYRQFR